MYRPDITKFVDDVRHKKIAMNNWPKHITFTPNGTLLYNAKNSLVTMGGQLTNNFHTFNVDMAVFNGFNPNPRGEKWVVCT